MSKFENLSSASGVPEHNYEKEYFIEKVQYFFSNNELEVRDQLEIIGSSWNELGLSIPELDTEQYSRLHNNMDLNMTSRVLPTPIIDPEARLSLFKSLAYLKDDALLRKCHVVLPNNASFYKKALDDNNQLRFGYRDSQSRIRDYRAFREELVSKGHGIRSSQEVLWIFPVIKFNSVRNINRDYAGNVFMESDSINTPETYMMLELLRWTLGLPSRTQANYITNEAIFRQDNTSKIAELSDVVTVGWMSRTNSLVLNSYFRGRLGPGFKSSQATYGI